MRITIFIVYFSFCLFAQEPSAIQKMSYSVTIADPVVDSLQAVSDRWYGQIKRDRVFKKVLMQAPGDQPRYLNYLLINHLSDTARVLKFIAGYKSTLETDIQKLQLIIKNIEDVDAKYSINLHIKKNKSVLTGMAAVESQLSDSVPEITRGGIKQKLEF